MSNQAEPATTKERHPIPLRFRFPDYTSSSPSPPSPTRTTFNSDEDTSVEIDNYVKNVLAKEKPLPPITLRNWWKNLQGVSCVVLLGNITLAIYGAIMVDLCRKTAVWSLVYYVFTGLSITAGYHRLWSHRSYTASLPLQYFLALGGSGAVQGSIKWWSRGHRAHHRYTDTSLDPYNSLAGLFYSHIGWMLFKPRRKPGFADVSDLAKSEVIRWQHRWYLVLIPGMAFVLPMMVAGVGWGDWKGGFFWAGAVRLAFVHQSTFCINSLAHYLGEASFDDKHTPRDHFLTALVTLGEGYHNFHHEFPQDYRNAIRFYQYDPTKWFIFACCKLGLASQLKTFPDNEIKKGQYAMKLKEIQKRGKEIVWPKTSNGLPVITWDQFAEECKHRQLVVISGFIHDVSSFVDEHPGGRHFILSRLGKDATTAFYGGVYDHSNAANALLAMYRVGCIEGGYEVESLKKYSEVIAALAESGGNGASAKGADPASTITGKKMVPIVGKSEGMELERMTVEPRFDRIDLQGGLY